MALFDMVSSRPISAAYNVFSTRYKQRWYQFTNNSKTQNRKITKKHTSLGPFVFKNIYSSLLVGLSSVSISSLSSYLTHKYPPRYLPPPILERLSDETLEATKRAAVITNALTWFFNNLPIDLFPPVLTHYLVPLQQLIPLISFIASLISWAWSSIRGNGFGKLILSL